MSTSQLIFGNLVYKEFHSAQLFPNGDTLIEDEKIKKAVEITNIIFKSQNKGSLKEASICAARHYNNLSKEFAINDVTFILKELINQGVAAEEVSKIGLHYGYGFCVHKTSKLGLITFTTSLSPTEVQTWRETLQERVIKKLQGHLLDEYYCKEVSSSSSTHL